MTPAERAVLDGMPEILRRQMEFPYLDGQVFVTTLLGQGGWGSVDAAWDELPASTEQILHPETVPSDKPVKVDLPDVASVLGGGWTASDQRTLGELGIGVCWSDGGDGSDRRGRRTAGAAIAWSASTDRTAHGPWSGRRPGTPTTDADEFTSAADAAMADLPGAHAVLRGDGHHGRRAVTGRW